MLAVCQEQPANQLQDNNGVGVGWREGHVNTPETSDWLLQEAKCWTKIDFAQTSREVLIVETECCGSSVIEWLICDKQFSTYTVIMKNV